MTYYCWHCYARNDAGSGPCVRCGQEIAAPADASESECLIWAIRHPNPDVAIIATRRLADHPGAAVEQALHEAVQDPPDPYVAVEALRSLLSLSFTERERSLLQELARSGPVMLRALAKEALGRGA